MAGIAFDPFETDPLTQQRNQLMTQNVMPQLQAPPAAIAAPTMQAPATVQYHNPLADIYGASHESVLSTQPQQDKMGATFNKFIQSAVDGADGRAQREMTGAKIFGGAAAALGGLMGGGYAQGGMQVLQHTQQQIQDARTERHLQQQEALTGMKTIADLVANTSPYSQKALASRTKAEMEAAKQSRVADGQNASSTNKQNTNAINLMGKETNQNHLRTADAWKGLGIIQHGSEVDNKLTAGLTMASEMIDLKREISQLNNATAQQKTSEDYKKAMINVQERWNAAKLMRRAIAESADMKAQMAIQGMYQNGGAKFEETQLPSMLKGVDADISELETDMPWATGEPAAAASQAPPLSPPSMGAPVGRVNPAQVGGAGKAAEAPDSIKTGVRVIMSMSGMPVEQAKPMFIESYLRHHPGSDEKGALALWEQMHGRSKAAK